MNKFHRERELYSWCCFKYNLSGITRYGHKGHGNLIIWRSLVVKYTWRLGINYGKTTRRKLRHRAIDIFTGRMKKEEWKPKRTTEDEISNFSKIEWLHRSYHGGKKFFHAVATNTTFLWSFDHSANMRLWALSNYR